MDAPFSETAKYATVLGPGGDAALLRVGPQGPASLRQSAALSLLGEMKLAVTTEAGRESPVKGADWKTSSWRNVRVVVRDGVWVSARRVKIHDEVPLASLVKVRDMDSVPAPLVRLLATDEPGTGVRVSSSGRIENFALLSVRGRQSHASRPRFALRTVVIRGWRHRARVAARENVRWAQAWPRSNVLRSPLHGGQVVPRVL